MSNNILDEYEQYAGPRTCPNCGSQFPFVKFVKRYLMSYGSSKWHCQNCRELIKCDFIKVQVKWLVGLLTSGVIIGALTAFFDVAFPNLIFLIINFALVFLTLFYVKFEKQN